MNATFRFALFIFFAISIYSLLNFYFIRKHKNLLTARSLPVILLRLMLVTIIMAPVATFVFSFQEMPLMAAITGFTGYSWLAFLFLFLVIHGIADVILFILEKTGMVPSRHLAGRVLAITMTISISVLIYGYYEAADLKIERMTVNSPRLSPPGKKIKILQLSDVHFSPIISVPMARRIRDLVKRERPDLILCTGDLLDHAIRNSTEIVEILRELRPPLGKYAVTGNHEFIAGIKHSEKFIAASGFTLLRNRSVVVGRSLTLAGVDDLSAAQFGVIVDRPENEVLRGADRSHFTILMKHQPRIESESLSLMDLQLSGHTHDGQIFPFVMVVKLLFPHISGTYPLAEGTLLHVNRGTGTWGPPIRFLAWPEATIITLIGESKK